ncbi:hypothetical protein SODALDRAFT_363103 [Sodiomyces alkalinus F11]|uniref:Uncharacterized protein n=1 Tax=Sodiomyces alkalinus (strain CBS 110278 / VKM F-3762 / F11) TaxID=1314773 RepID=A0A3N2PL76_SODAK|nr:hypothetical protein SODALDRAFT_363103 [Sodiomyces alkalinus F11]ROT35291.1 hypothetical protein SODALDRAFT_363103 [Sodiomyces alkalinus F11]
MLSDENGRQVADWAIVDRHFHVLSVFNRATPGRTWGVFNGIALTPASAIVASALGLVQMAMTGRGVLGRTLLDGHSSGRIWLRSVKSLPRALFSKTEDVTAALERDMHERLTCFSSPRKH